MHKSLLAVLSLVLSLNINAAEAEKSWWEGFKESVSNVFSVAKDETAEQATAGKEAAESVAGSVKDKAADAVDAVKETAGDVKEKAVDKASDAKEAATAAAGDLKDRASAIADGFTKD